jgi:hypothetical protein
MPTPASCPWDASPTVPADPGNSVVLQCSLFVTSNNKNLVSNRSSRASRNKEPAWCHWRTCESTIDQARRCSRRAPHVFHLGKLNQSPNLRWLGVSRVDTLECVAHHRRRPHGLDRGSLFSVLAHWFRTRGRAASCAHLLSLPLPTTF